MTPMAHVYDRTRNQDGRCNRAQVTLTGAGYCPVFKQGGRHLVAEGRAPQSASVKVKQRHGKSGELGGMRSRMQ